VKRVGMIWILPENLLLDRCRFRKLSPLMMTDGLVDEL